MVSVFQFVVTHPVAIEFDFPSIAPLLPSHYGSIVFGCRASFLVGSSIFFLSMVVQQLVVILLFP